MGTIQNLAGDTANIAKGSDPASNHLLANTGTVNAVLSLNAATTGNGSAVDFGSAKKTVSFQIVPAGSISAGAVTLQISSDAVTWFTVPVAGAAPAAGLVTLCATAAANPATLATGTQLLYVINVNAAIRYARANVSTNVTGTGASVSVQISAA